MATLMKHPPIKKRMCTCKQCKYEWLTKLEGRDPLICPSCRSWYWKVDPEHTPHHTPRKPRSRKR